MTFPCRFGPYVLVQGLGMGETGTVALGLMGTRNLERLCVVKRLRPELIADRRARARAQREVNIARGLSHGGIAQTFAAGELAGEIYLVQEYIEGWSLKQLMTSCAEMDRWPSVALSCYIVREIAQALAYLHSADGGGIIHRDIAPSNIMLSFSGEVKLIDFGIAKSLDDTRAPDAARYTYGAPEMQQGEADPRSDLYGLAVVLWSLLAHELDPDDVLRERRAPSADEDVTIEGPPAPSNFTAEVPPELDGVVLRALSFFQDHRYQSAVSFDAALGSFIPAEFVGPEEIRQFFRKHTYPKQRHEWTVEQAREAARLLDDPSSRPPAAGEIVTLAAEASEAKFDQAAKTAVVGTLAEEQQPHTDRRAAGVRWARVIGAVVAIAGATALYRAGHRESPPAPPLPTAAAAPPPASRPAPPPPSTTAAVATLSSLAPRAEPPPPSHHDSARRRPPLNEGQPPPPAISTAELLALAEADLDRDRLDQALELAKRAAASGAGAPAHVVAGNALMKRRDFKAAEREFAAAILLDPSNALARRRAEQAREHAIESKD